jgi:HK97 family phage portal protein
MTGLPPETFDNLNGRGTSSAEPSASASSGLANPSGWFVDWATGGAGNSDIRVNEFTAYNYAAFYTCVTLIAGTVAGLPLKVYRKRADGGQDEVGDHPAADLLGREFNGNTSSMTGRSAEIGHLLTWGNQYTQIVRSRAGELLELRPVGPDVVCPETRANGDLYYEVRDRDGARLTELDRAETLHTPAFSFDAMVGMSPVRVGRGLLRQGLGQDRRAERFALRGFRPPGAIRIKKRFKETAEAIQFRDRLRQYHQNSGDEDNVLILEEEAEWQDLGISPDKAQALESRKFTRGEMAGFFHIPPHLMGDVEKTTSWGTGIEEQNIGFVVYCLLPILRALEQERNRKLFRRDRRADAGLYVEHVLAGLLRGDTLKQAQALEIYARNGIITVNEWRRLIGFNPIPGGNVRYFPLNFGRTDSDTGEDIPPPPPAESPALLDPVPLASNGKPAALPPGPTPALVAFRKKLGQDLGRCLRKEAAEAVKSAKKPAAFVAWVEEFYARHAEQVREVYDTDLTAGFADRHLSASRAALLTAAECRPDELSERVARCVERWPTDRVTDTLAELTHAI